MVTENNNSTLVVRCEEELNEENVFELKYSKKNYVIKIQLVKLNKEPYIRIIAQEEKKIVNYNYLVEMNKDDFNKQDNILLRPYRDIQGIYYFILDSFDEKKIFIKNINNKICFNLVIEGEIRGYKKPFTFELNLKKHDCSKDDIEEMVCNKTNELEKENKTLKDKVNELEEDNKNLKHQVNELKEEIHNLTVKSKEIIRSEKEMEFIKTQLNQISGRENKKVRFELKYRITEDGDSIKTFHSKCDNIPNNLVLIKSSSGARFGGYTDKPWTSSDNYIKDNNSFYFSLSNRKIYNVIKDKNALINYSNYGPSFYNMVSIGTSSLSYGNCTSCIPNNGNFSGVSNNYEINGGYSSFIVLELEFYQVIFE